MRFKLMFTCALLSLGLTVAFAATRTVHGASGNEGPRRDTKNTAAGAIDFYGLKKNVVRMFLQTSFTEASPGKIGPSGIYHAAGVVVGKLGTATLESQELIKSFENE